MQASSSWTTPVGVLGELVAEARLRAEALTAHSASLREGAARAPLRRPFSGALEGACVAVIAEIKRRSPSKGDINPGISPGQRAVTYASSGAAALSVLTQHSRFGGSVEDLQLAARAVDVPLLRKDFIVAPIQIVEARSAGASAVLLIARALSPAELPALARAAADEGLETLVEVRDEGELETAVAARASVIGVNNRNLESLAIDPAVSERLIPLIPADRPAVYESGVGARADVERAAACGADAVLVGSVLSAAADPAALAGSLTSVPRTGRGG